MSHEGVPFNELADDLAKAAARELASSGSIAALHPDWYDDASPLSEWAWLVDLTPEQKARA